MSNENQHELPRMRRAKAAGDWREFAAAAESIVRRLTGRDLSLTEEQTLPLMRLAGENEAELAHQLVLTAVAQWKARGELPDRPGKVTVFIN